MTAEIRQERAPIVEHTQLAERTYRIRVAAPEIARRIMPGQFLMVRIPDRQDPLLARPFAVYDVLPDGSALDFVYLVLGKMTSLLPQMTVGQDLEVWGPLGQPFPILGSTEPVTCVAGGIGQTPFLAWAKELCGLQQYGNRRLPERSQSVKLLYGVRSAALAAGVEDFRAVGVTVSLASDDGSIGHKGYVTELLKADPDRGVVVACGPEPMLKVVAGIAELQKRECYVSLETPMACGAGICFSCVTRVRTGLSEWDYKRVCMDGPVFPAQQLVWE